MAFYYSTPAKAPKPPPGGIVINIKWQGTPLGNAITKSSSSIFYEGLGVIDFFLSDVSPVVYLPHSELIDIHAGQLKLKNLVGCYPKGILLIILERNTKTIDLYNSYIDYIIFDLDSNMNVLPISNQQDLPSFLLNLAYFELNTPTSNPFLRKVMPNLNETQMRMVKLIPGVGEKKANILLEKFGNLEAIATATVQTLNPVIGTAGAKRLREFFNDDTIRLKHK